MNTNLVWPPTYKAPGNNNTTSRNKRAKPYENRKTTYHSKIKRTPDYSIVAFILAQVTSATRKCDPDVGGNKFSRLDKHVHNKCFSSNYFVVFCCQRNCEAL